MLNEIPRRCRLDQMVPAEKAIYDAMQAVEAMPADVRLTDAVVLLGQARAKVADFIEGIEAVGRTPREEPTWQSIESAPKDKSLVLVALVRDGAIWRVSEAAFNGLGWYTKSGEACHWRTHWMPLAALRAGSGPPAAKE